MDIDLLKHLFIEKNLTSYEIAELTGSTVEEVVSSLKQLNLSKPIKTRKYELINKIPFTNEQKSFIIGCILGNGKLKKHSSLYYLDIEEKDKKIILWKKKIICDFVNVIDNRNEKFHFQTCDHNNFKQIYSLMYDNNKKIIKNNLINYVTDLSLAVLFVDSGIVTEQQTCKLQTSKYSLIENEELKKILKINFGINSKICTFTRNNIEYYYISVNKRNTEILLSKIKKHII